MQKVADSRIDVSNATTVQSETPNERKNVSTIDPATGSAATDSTAPIDEADKGDVVSKSARIRNMRDAPYDPYDYGNERNPTSFWETVFHLYMVTAGPALLSVPKSFMALGYVYGSGLVCAVFLYHWYATRTIVRVEYALCRLLRRPRMSYADTVYHAFAEGPPRLRCFASYSRAILQVLYCVTWIGALNIVLAGQNLQTCLNNVLGGAYVGTQAAILYTFAPLLLLTLVHRLKFLVPASVAGNGIVVLCIVTVSWHALRDTSSLRMPPAFGDLRRAPNCLAAILFVMNATGLMLPLKNEMKEPKKFNSDFGVLTVTYGPMAILYALFNILCCMKYGALLRDSVIENLPKTDVVAQIMIFLFAAALVLQQPLVTYVVFDTLWNNVLADWKKMAATPSIWEYFTRVSIFLVSFAAALAVPNINVFMAISGTLGTAVDSMILPAMAETLVARRTGCGRRTMVFYYVKNMLIIFLALILVVIALSSCAAELTSTYARRR